MNETLIAVLSAFLGFALSQVFNLVEFVRRPRFKVANFETGVISSYTGDPPETPWEIDLGFYLKNVGWNPATGVRVFMSELRAVCRGDERESTTDILELRRPLDYIPAGEAVAVLLGRITSETRSLRFCLQDETVDQEENFLECNTREAITFRATFHVCCDDKNATSRFSLEFRPDQDRWAGELLKDYEAEPLRRFGDL